MSNLQNEQENIRRIVCLYSKEADFLTQRTHPFSSSLQLPNLNIHVSLSSEARCPRHTFHIFVVYQGQKYSNILFFQNLLTKLTTKTSRLAGFCLLILIYMFILLYQRQQFSEHPYSIRLQFSCIQQLPLLFHPIQHQVLLNPMLGGIPMISLYKTNHLLIPNRPFLILCHNVLFVDFSTLLEMTKGLLVMTKG